MSNCVKISCGLGNQLFQYAFGRACSIQNGTDLEFDITDYETDSLRKFELEKFNVSRMVFRKKERIPFYSIRTINRLKNPTFKYAVDLILNYFVYGFLIHLHPRYVQETSFRFNKKNFAPRNSAYFSGYWQSYRYFDSIRELLIDEITPKFPLDKKNADIVGEMESTNSIAVHFRRGDYVTMKSFFAPNLVPCPPSYYEKAIGHVKSIVKNPTFFVFSDDITWVRENFFKNENVRFIDWNTRDNSYKDLILMASAKHAIIANSTFSWWGAYLNKNPKKIVICPEKWFNKKGLNSEITELYPSDWIKLPNN